MKLNKAGSGSPHQIAPDTYVTQIILDYFTVAGDERTAAGSVRRAGAERIHHRLQRIRQPGQESPLQCFGGGSWRSRYGTLPPFYLRKLCLFKKLARKLHVVVTFLLAVGSPIFLVKTHLQTCSSDAGLSVGYQHHHGGMGQAFRLAPYTHQSVNQVPAPVGSHEL